MEKNLLAVVNKPLSSGSDMSQPIIPDPTRSCSISPAVTIGPIPSSIRVPRFEANIIRRYVRSQPPPAATPYNGISVMTKYKISVMAVQKIFSLNPTLRVGGAISGRNRDMGLKRDRNLPAMCFFPFYYWHCGLILQNCVCRSNI